MRSKTVAKKVRPPTAMNRLLRCYVSPGMFSSERGISFNLADGTNVAAFVDREDVVEEKEPAPGQSVSGLVKVSVVGNTNDGVLIDLPQPTISQGSRIIVRPDMLKEVCA